MRDQGTWISDSPARVNPDQCGNHNRERAWHSRPVKSRAKTSSFAEDIPENPRVIFYCVRARKASSTLTPRAALTVFEHGFNHNVRLARP